MRNSIVHTAKVIGPFLLASIQLTHGATMAGNLSSSGSFDQLRGDLICGVSQIASCGFHSPIYTAVPFKPKSTARLGQVMLPLEEGARCYGCSVINVRIETDKSGLPSGDAIESFTVTNLAGGVMTQLPAQLIVLRSTQVPLLQSGTQYWLVAKPATSTSMGIWSLSLADNSTFAQFVDTSWILSKPSNYTPAFQINDVDSPNITAIANGASFKPPGYVISNSWATIQGTNLASAVKNWNDSIVNGKLPTTLDGVSVTIAGKSSYICFISSTQINLLVPDSVASGPVQVTLSNAAGSTAIITQAYTSGPVFFSWPDNQVVATRQDFSLVAKGGTFAGATSVPAKPGEVIILWGTGFGSTTPVPPSGVQVPSDRTYPVTMLPSVTINDVPATVIGAALAPGYAGLYQVAILVPPSMPDGDWPVSATIGNWYNQFASKLVLSVRR